MKAKTIIFATALVAFSSVVIAEDKQAGHDDKYHWDYSSGEKGPEFWDTVSAKFKACKKGVNQSPIDIKGAIQAELTPIEFSYNENGATEIINNGHTIQVNYAPGSFITVEGRNFELKQFHFHTPSENLIEGKSFPLEAHFVHADKDGNIAVVGVMYDSADENPAIKALWDKMPEKVDGKSELKDINLSYLLPENREYYRFNGSLTTPPCTEGVMWMVLKESVEISDEQVKKFAKVVHDHNNRPVQPVNSRPVLK